MHLKRVYRIINNYRFRNNTSKTDFKNKITCLTKYLKLNETMQLFSIEEII